MLMSVKQEVLLLIGDRLAALQLESARIHGLMEQAQFRIGVQGPDVKLNDIQPSVTEWQRIASEVQALQEVVAIIEAHE